MRCVLDRDLAGAGALVPCKVVHGPMAWNSSAMTTGWSGSPGRWPLRLLAERTGMRAGGAAWVPPPTRRSDTEGDTPVTPVKNPGLDRVLALV